MNYHQIFPTIIGQINFDISKELFEEIEYLKNTNFETHKYYEFTVSKNKAILEDSPFIKNMILKQIQDYSSKALNLNKKLKITQSWVTKQDSKSTLFPHRHQNSIVSGSFYLNANESQSGLTFYKDDILREKYIDWIDNIESNQYNYTDITFKCITGTLILFPSYLKHSVIENSNNENRFSLAFNTWFDESIGMWENLNYLGVQ